MVNVTKDAIWTRKAALPDAAMPRQPSPKEAIALFDLSPAQTFVRFPDPRHSVADIQEPFVREQEIDPRKYYPADVYRKPSTVFPDGYRIDVKKMVQQKIEAKLDAKAAELMGGTQAELSHLVEFVKGEGQEIIEQALHILEKTQGIGPILKQLQDFASARRKAPNETAMPLEISGPRAARFP